MLPRSVALAPLLAVALGAGCAAESDTIDDEVSCTLALDYWRTHEAMWPVTELALGDQTYAQDDLMSMLRSSSTADGSVALAAELTAALLNQEEGATPSAEVAIAIADAHDWLVDAADGDGRLPFAVTRDASEGYYLAAQALALELRDFNNGTRGVLRCQLD